MPEKHTWLKNIIFMLLCVLITSWQLERHQQNVVIARFYIWIFDLYDRHVTQKISRQIASDCLDVGVQHTVFFTDLCTVIPAELPFSACCLCWPCVDWDKYLPIWFFHKRKVTGKAEDLFFCRFSDAVVMNQS